MPRRIVTLTTDFGTVGSYVGALKGVILSINPDVSLVDIAHDIPPQDVRHAALVLADAAPFFPPETVHLAVVDPGVGSDRRIVYARIGRHDFVAPDNGILSRLAAATPPAKIITVSEPDFWLPEVSATFHGRDIMAPVAARLARGLAPERLGPRQQGLVELDWPEVCVLASQLEGEVVAVDRFGNLVTNITAEMLRQIPADASAVVRCDEHETVGIFSTYADQPEMTLIALVGSSGHLELALVNDRAEAMLGVSTGTKVTVRWQKG